MNLKDRKGLEFELFSWEDWSDIDTLTLSFSNCILKKSIGSHQAGTRVPSITLNGEYGYLKLFFNNRPSKVYELGLSVGDKI